MKRPNFFIVGAPKCGTTSVAAWLAAHPRIFMCPAKEPHFFNTDHKRTVNSLATYEAFFQGAEAQHLAVGEASVWYLYSETAVPNILAYAPDAKFIVMLRDPVEMAPSLHDEMLFTGVEDVADFAAAWALQQPRHEGRALPRLCWEPKRLQYGEACRLGLQLERLLSLVPRERVLTVLLEDLQSNPREQYLRILQFLQVPDDGRSEFPALNAAKRRRWPLLPRIANAASEVKRRLGIEWGFGVWRHIDRRNQASRARVPLAPALRAELRRYFTADIRLLQTLLQRDLQHWLA